MKKILNLVKKIIVYLVMALLMLHLVFSGLFPDKMMQTLGYRNFVVLSPSMEPVIDVGDMIVIRNIEEVDIEVGDIITFYVYIEDLNQSEYVTHYVANTYTNDDGETVYQTQGYGKASGDYDDWVDANNHPIEITYSDIEGIYMFSIPWIGYIAVFLSNPIYFTFIVINIVVIYYTIKYIKKQSYKEQA